MSLSTDSWAKATIKETTDRIIERIAQKRMERAWVALCVLTLVVEVTRETGELTWETIETWRAALRDDCALYPRTFDAHEIDRLCDTLLALVEPA